MIWFDKCIVLFRCIIEVFLLFDYFRNFFEFRLKKKTIIIIFITICIVLFGINMIENATVNLIMFPLLMWIFVSVLFESRLSIRIGYFVTAYTVMIGVEFLFLILSQTTSKLLLKTGVVPVSDYGWQIVVVKFINFIAFLILKQTSDKSHTKMTNKLFFTYLCVPMKINNDSSNLNRICIAQNEKEIARIYPKYTNGILDWVMVVFNTGDYSFTSSGTSGSFDIQSIATHELGHAIGVAHCHEIGESCNSSTCSSNVMNPTIKENTIRRTLTDYDKSSKRVNYLN